MNQAYSRMTLQWTFVATFLYAEIFIIILLLLPFISPARWQAIFRSRLMMRMTTYSHIYFNVLIFILGLLFLDALREVGRYAEPVGVVDLKHNHESETVAHMKLFRAQRNFYIAGFALFLWFVIRRLVILTATHAKLLAESEASRKQAESATAAAQQLLDDKQNKANKGKEEEIKEAKLKPVVDAASNVHDLTKELNQTRYELEKAREELHHAKLDLDSMRKQAASTNKEYDRLLKEHELLQAQTENDPKKDK